MLLKISLIALMVSCATESVVSGENNTGLMSTADMTLKLSLDPEGGIYTILLKNDGEESQTFLDWFFDKSRYERIPGSLRVSVRIDGEIVEDTGGSVNQRSFSPRVYTNGTYVLVEDVVADICGLCALERMYRIEDLMNDMFNYLLMISRGRRETDSSVDIRKLELKLSVWTEIVVGHGGFLRLRAETDWVTLRPDHYTNRG